MDVYIGNDEVEYEQDNILKVLLLKMIRNNIFYPILRRLLQNYNRIQLRPLIGTKYISLYGSR